MGLRLTLLALSVAAVGGCAGTPPPDWALDAHAALQDTVAAALQGDERTEAAGFARAQRALRRAGRTDLLARAELLRCAAHAARLDGGDCPGFHGLEADATAADHAYAALLSGRLQPAQSALLPEHHRRAAAGEAGAPGSTDDPLARLVAAATLLRAGQADRATVALAVDTASAQGWQRALQAWLQAQQRMAERAGDAAEAARVQRRLEAVIGPR